MADETDPVPSQRGASREECPHPTIVGIGASAGGLEALQQLLARIPADTGLAYVVVVHLSPEHESHLAELLQPHVDMPVTQVTDTVVLEPDHVYVIPPNANLDAVDTHLRLSDLEEQRAARAPVDHFFRTLSETHDGNAVGVVLTGTGSDGTLGVNAIKAAGGLTIVQDPDEAEYAGMPRSAVATGAVDLVLPLAEIPEAIFRYARAKPQVPDLADGEDLDADHRDLLQQMFSALATRTGKDFSRYKRSTVLRRIGHRMQLRQIRELREYAAFLDEEPGEVRSLADDLLITVTSFFRDPEVFEILEKVVIPKLFDRTEPDQELRVWSVGCATGEEAYSVAMLLLEHRDRRDAASPALRVFATDLHEPSLERGRRGVYGGDLEGDLDAERLNRFFRQENGGYRLRQELRDVVVFSRHDLLADPPFSHLDLVLCRNLLIYLQPDAQEDALGILHYALEPDGYLVLGTAETPTGTDLFRAEDERHRLYRPERGAPARPGLSVFSLRPPRIPEIGTRDDPADVGSPGRLHQRLVERLAPPSLLVGPDDRAVHLSERAGRYLLHPGGEVTASVTDLVREELRTELEVTLHRARERGEPARSSPVDLSLDGSRRRVVLDVRPSPRPEQEGFALVIFDERPRPDEGARPEGPEAREPRGEEAQGEDVTDTELKAELSRARQQLRSARESYHVNQQKMQAANEELQSMNEELRSAMEELETSKEELQSMNEELQTLNQENRHKVRELAQLTGDLQNLLKATDIATLFLDRDLRIMRFTPRASSLFNIQEGDRGRPISHLTNRLGYDELVADGEDVLEHLTPIEREVRDEEEGCTYLLRILPYRSTEDRIEGVVLTFIDISGRKEMEEALREAKTFSESIVQTLHEPLLVLTPELEVVHANPAFYEQFEVDAEETVGREIYELGDGQWDIPELHRLLETVLPAEETFHDFEVEHDFEGLGRRTLLLNARQLDHVHRVLLGIRDITERRALEQHLRQKHRMESVGRLAGGLAHDFNNLLTAVQAHASLLAEELGESSPLQQEVQQIQRAGRRAADLIKQLLAFSREQVLRERNVRLGQVVLSLEPMLRRLVSKKIELEMSVPDEDPVVRADPTQVQQVVLNLVVNASEAIEGNGRIFVEVDGIDLSEANAEEIPWEASAGAYGRLTVRDTGAGMSSEMIERAFEPFFTSKDKALGAGLGLATVYGIVKQSGGHVRVHSPPGEGTTFEVLLPRVPPSDDDVTGTSVGDDQVPADDEPEQRQPQPGRRVILVVEDDDSVRRIACRVLARADYTVVEAASGEEALAHVERDPSIDLVLSDVVMPGLGGAELAERLAGERPELPVVFMSGYTAIDAAEGLTERAVGFIQKPFTAEELLRSVQRALARGHREA